MVTKTDLQEVKTELKELYHLVSTLQDENKVLSNKVDAFSFFLSKKYSGEFKNE